MAPFDQGSALYGLDGDNIDSIRKLMNGIMHRLAGVPAATVAELDDLDIYEHGTMIYLTENARRNELLARIIIRFASARYGNSRTVREAARELDLVAIDAVLSPNARPRREFVVAEGFFNQLVANDAATYGEGAEDEYGDIEPDTDDEQKDNKKKDKDPKNPRKRTRASLAAPQPAHKKTRMGASWSDDEAMDDLESIPDYLDGYDDDDFEDIKMPIKKDPAAAKHTAKRKHGERCLPDPNVSRDNAVVGQPDPSKLSFVLKTERPDPATPGAFLPSDPINFMYGKEVDWDNKESVGKLNSWRYQVFKRTLGQKRESRPPWTINEKDKLLQMMHTHLSSTETGGRYSKINWVQIEQDFNQFFQGYTHRKGEMTAETSYNQRGKDYTAKSRQLVADRLHLPRSAGAIENQLTHFTDPLTRSLVASARQADQNAPFTPSTTNTQSNGKVRASTSTSAVKRKHRAKRVKKEDSEDYFGFEHGEALADEDFEDSMINNKMVRQSGGKVYRRRR